MLYQNRITGGLVEVVSQHGEGILMCFDANEEVLYIDEDDLTPHLDATMDPERRMKQRLTESLAAEGVKPAKAFQERDIPN